MRVVVVGSGRVGLRTARLLDDRGHSVTIVERNPERVRAAGDAYVATIIEGDATRPSILEQAGIADADAVAALTDTMGTNLAVCGIAKRVAPSVRTVMRTVHPEDEGYDAYADEVLFPEGAGARVALNAIAGGVRSMESVSGTWTSRRSRSGRRPRWPAGPWTRSRSRRGAW
jgi:trk system potassium uptake protein TrkA